MAIVLNEKKKEVIMWFNYLSRVISLTSTKNLIWWNWCTANKHSCTIETSPEEKATDTEECYENNSILYHFQYFPVI